jgi:hypothetical protein
LRRENPSIPPKSGRETNFTVVTSLGFSESDIFLSAPNFINIGHFGWKINPPPPCRLRTACHPSSTPPSQSPASESRSSLRRSC